MVMNRQISEKTRKIIIGFQENELTEALVYEKIAGFIKNDEDKKTLLAIAADERRHAAVWKG